MKEIIPFCNNMHGLRVYHAKHTISKRERQIPYNIIYMWNLKYTQINLSMKLTDIDKKNWICQGRMSRGGSNWKFGISRYKLLYIGWINNNVLLYKTKYNIQYPVIKHNRKYEKEYMCITESLCYTAEIKTIL